MRVKEKLQQKRKINASCKGSSIKAANQATPNIAIVGLKEITIIYKVKNTDTYYEGFIY